MLPANTSMSFNLPNPCLRGILLIISTHSGPQLLYKYGAFDLVDHSVVSDGFEEEQYEMDSAFEFNRGSAHRRKSVATIDSFASGPRKPRPALTPAQLPKANSISDPILGIEPTYLCEMLAPPRKMCNSRFDLTVGDGIFVGLPIHRFDDGSWRQSSPVKRRSARKRAASLDDHTEDGPSLSLFHLVFVMFPVIVEGPRRVEEMFQYVASRVSLVLRYEQHKHQYVTKEAKKILALRESLKGNSDLEDLLLLKSELCGAIRDCYLSISQSKIANLKLNEKLRSFQIPVKTEFHSLPRPGVPYISGSHLSSTVHLVASSGLISVGETTRYGTNNSNGDASHSSNNENDDVGHGTADDSNIMFLALLLLDDPELIIQDIKTDTNGTLAKFIRETRPTESLVHVSQRMSGLGLDRGQVRSFAFHLIYWRRARMIQPLSTRATYIVSPMAPIASRLGQDSHAFKSAFPTFPSLPQFLKLLSSMNAKPQRFATIIPSKDHRDGYIEALAWLVRRGYVTQLLTFVRLKISRKIQLKVDEDLENDLQIKRKPSRRALKKVPGTDNTSKSNTTTDSTPITLALALQGGGGLSPDTKDSLKMASAGHLVKFDEESNTVLLDPGKATTLERKWINKLIQTECNLSPEMTSVFYKLLNYFDGNTSFELLLLKENVSRPDLRALLHALDGHILSVKHW